MKFICYPKCSTCKKAQKWLDARDIPYEFRDITQENPTAAELKEWHAKTGLPLRRLFNTSGQLYRSMNLKDKIPTMSEDEIFQLLSTDGMLVKRPLLVTDDKVLVGFKESEWEETIG
jgi:arsenate reductase